MSFWLALKLTFKNLRSRKGRSFLTILGIVIGVSGVIIIIALGAGAQSLILSQVTKLGSNLLGILPGKSDETGPPAAAFGIQVTTLMERDVEAMMDKSRAPHVVAAIGSVQGPATVIWGAQSIDTTFNATQAAYTQLLDAPLENGRFFDEREERAAVNVIVLGSVVKQELFGNEEAVGKVVKIKNVLFSVIGVMKERGTVAFQNQDDLVFIPLRVGQRQLLGIRHLLSASVKVDDSKNLDAAIADIKQILRENHHISDPENDDFSVRNPTQALELLGTITNAMRLFLTAMAAISLVVGGIGIMNIMLAAVSERTREIGLRKALGATAKAVRNQFLFEAMTVTLLGGIVGIAAGALISYGIALLARAQGYEWAFVISALSIALAVGVSGLTGIIFGLYPAYKAAKLDPIEALRYE